MAVRNGVMTRGTTNRNARGGSVERLRRREWLVATYRADVDVVVLRNVGGSGQDVLIPVDPRCSDFPDRVPACRCYRCGALLTVETVSADRIIPGCQGGTYRRDNIRPCCGRCNSITGGATRSNGKGAVVPGISARRNSRRLAGRTGSIIDQASIGARKAAPCRECGAQPGFSCNSLTSVRQVREGREGAYLKPMAKLHKSRGAS